MCQALLRDWLRLLLPPAQFSWEMEIWRFIHLNMQRQLTPRRRVCCSRRLAAFSLRTADRLAYSAAAFFSAGSIATARLAR